MYGIVTSWSNKEVSCIFLQSPPTLWSCSLILLPEAYLPPLLSPYFSTLSELLSEESHKYEDIEFPSWNKIRLCLHFLRLSDEGIQTFGEKMSKVMHSLWFVGMFIAIDETIVPDLSMNLRSVEKPKKRKREELNFPLKEDRAPNVRIVGKPHERGILIYGLVAKTKIRSLPIFVALNIILNPITDHPCLRCSIYWISGPQMLFVQYLLETELLLLSTPSWLQTAIVPFLQQ